MNATSSPISKNGFFTNDIIRIEGEDKESEEIKTAFEKHKIVLKEIRDAKKKGLPLADYQKKVEEIKRSHGLKNPNTINTVYSKCLVIGYGELFLKKKNRHLFIQQLVNNLSLVLKKNNFIDLNIRKFFDRLIITSENNESLLNLMPRLEKIAGISNFYLAYQLESNVENLSNFAENFSDYYEINFTTFCLSIKRNDKLFPKNSFLLQKELGEVIRKKYNLRVDLTNPDKTFSIRIYQDFMLIFSEKIKGLGGLPVGSAGKILLLLSGGIDSPVAAYQLMKRGLEVIYLHFYYQKEGQEKILALVEKLQVYNNYSRTVYLVDFQPVLTEISHISQEKYRLIILKRMFIRLACRLAEKLAIIALATGDSLAQVASQTVESLTVISQVSSLIIFRPLISFNKQEIIQLAQKIDTYSLALASYQDCCNLFEPRHPVTKPRLAITESLEKEIL
ncbi:23181_t:CDS:2 [Entrophospora sp. SA101]|nr:15113_t:CDS:2 [Entrophospora sp. SA101]CAJ0748913.1 23181_t:CDS:2 [Entrophospora sp. SA101]